MPWKVSKLLVILLGRETETFFITSSLNLSQFVHRRVKQVVVDVKVGPPLFEIDLAADVLAVVSFFQCKSMQPCEHGV